MEIKVRIAAGKVHIGSIKRLDCAEIFPVTVKKESIDVELLDGSGNNLISEVNHRCVGEQVYQHAALEEINAHRRQVRSLVGIFRIQTQRAGVRPHLSESVAFGFFAKLFDSTIRAEL